MYQYFQHHRGILEHLLSEKKTYKLFWESLYPFPSLYMLEISFCLSKEDDTEIKHWLGGLIMTVFTININQKIKRVFFFFLTVSLFISIIFFSFKSMVFFFKKKILFLILYLLFIGLFYFHDTNRNFDGLTIVSVFFYFFFNFII